MIFLNLLSQRPGGASPPNSHLAPSPQPLKLITTPFRLFNHVDTYVTTMISIFGVYLAFVVLECSHKQQSARWVVGDDVLMEWSVVHAEPEWNGVV